MQCFAKKLYFDSIYKKTIGELLQSDPEGALENVDLLLSISKDNKEKLKALFLKADLLRRYGLKNEAISIFLKADSIAKIENDYIALTRANGLLATTYREVNLQQTGEKHINKAIQSSKKIKNKRYRIKFQENLLEESAYIKLADKKYNEVIEIMRNANKLLLKVNNTITNIPFGLASNNALIAESHLGLKNTDSAFFYFSIAKEQLSKSHLANSPFKGYIYKGEGLTYQEIKAYNDAENYFLKAKTIADESNFFDLKKDVYNSMRNLYKEIDDQEKYVVINEQYLKLVNDEQVSRELIADKLIEGLYLKESKSNNKQRQKSLIIYTLITFLIIAIIILSWFIYRKKNNQKKFQTFLEEKYRPTVKVKPIPLELKEVEKEKRSYMSKEKEKSIIESLAKIEETAFYLDEDISLSALSTKIGINQRYLTYVIKKNKHTDFATYTDKLRINHIVDLIKTDPKFSQYKISYLDESCGFSSHSRFSVNFKKITGSTPSAFIAYVKKENEKKTS